MISKIERYLRDKLWLIISGIIIVTIITLALTLLPAGKVMTGRIWSYDKLGHFLMFGSWTFLIGYYRVLTKPKALNYFTLFLVGVIFGAAVEGLQYIMPYHRSADFMDIVFDALGCFVAVLILYLLQTRRKQSTS